MNAIQNSDRPPPVRERFIGIPQLTAYYLSNLVGAGIFVIPALAQQAAGSWVLLAWFVMVIGAIPTAWIMGRISIDFPNENGILLFISKVISARMAAATSQLIVIIMIVGNPIMGLISARYAIAAFELDIHLLYPLAIAFMFLSVMFNLLGMRNSSRIQTLFTAVVIMALIVLAAISIAQAEMIVPEPIPFHINGFFVAIGICFFAFLGWENVATIAPDVKNPERTFPITLMICVPLVGLTYLVVALALLLTTQSNGLNGNFAVMDHLVAAYTNPWLSFGANILALAVVVLSTNAWVLSAARLLSSAVRDGHLPAFCSPGTGGLDVQTMCTLAICYTLVLGLMYYFNGGEGAVVPLISAGFLVIYLVVFWGAMQHYHKASAAKFALTAFIIFFFFALSVWLNSLLVSVFLTALILSNHLIFVKLVPTTHNYMTDKD